MNIDTTKKIIAGISVGDINGIGLEVILKTFTDKRMLDFCTPVIFASNKVVSFHKKTIGLETPINTINSLDKIDHGKINLVTCWKDDVKLNIGTLTDQAGVCALTSLAKATEALKKDEVDILITAPINKENIQSSEFKFPGHTEYLEKNIGGKSLMMLMTDELRIGLITGHIPISDVSKTITPKLITEKVETMHQSLCTDFNINKPKIAVLGLNPHCGDNGVIGNEDNEIIKPTIKKIKETGKLVFGPYAADGFFGTGIYKDFDGVLAMYHDQGLAPFKALSFGNGVNFTAGLSKIRTSPDHGTGFDIAGKNKANPDSFKAALFSAIDIYKKRNDYITLKANALKTK